MPAHVTSCRKTYIPVFGCVMANILLSTWLSLSPKVALDLPLPRLIPDTFDIAPFSCPRDWFPLKASLETRSTNVRSSSWRCVGAISWGGEQSSNFECTATTRERQHRAAGQRARSCTADTRRRTGSSAANRAVESQHEKPRLMQFNLQGQSSIDPAELRLIVTS